MDNFEAHSDRSARIDFLPYMYILRCADGSLYTGSTWHLRNRVEQHRGGLGSAYTARRLPIYLAYFEEYDRVADAYARAKQVQGWLRWRKEELIAEGLGVRVTSDSTPLG